MKKNPDAVGVYRRGNIYWLAHQKRHKRTYVTLETDDYVTAVARAKEIRYASALNTGGLLTAERRYLTRQCFPGRCSIAIPASNRSLTP